MVEHFEAFQNFSLRLKTANFSSLKWVANSASRKIFHEITRTRTASKLSVLFAKKAYKLATCSNFTHIKELLQKEQGNLQSKVEDSMGNNNYKLGSDFFYDFLWQKREEYFGLSNKKSPKYPYSIICGFSELFSPPQNDEFFKSLKMGYFVISKNSPGSL